MPTSRPAACASPKPSASTASPKPKSQPPDAKGAHHAQPRPNAIRGARAVKVSNEQKKLLICNARRAYGRIAATGATHLTFEQWRREWLLERYRLESFRDIDQERFPSIMNTLRQLAGLRPFRKDYAPFTEGFGRVMEVPDDVRRARAKLDQLLSDNAARFGTLADARRYAESLFLRIHKTDHDHATAKQLWQVFFTLKNCIAAKARAAPAPPRHPLPPPDPPHDNRPLYRLPYIPAPSELEKTHATRR